MSKKYHFLYKTIRPKTGEFYIGVHSTNDPYDGYQGSGKRINYLKRKKRTSNNWYYDVLFHSRRSVSP